MKRALINSLEPGRVCEIREVGEEFEVADTFSWIDCADDVTTSHKYDQESGEFKPFDIVSQPGFAEEGYKVARTIAYGPIGNQLDMLYKELKNTGTISPNGEWAQHVANVKVAIPKDDPAAVQAWNEWYISQFQPPV